MSMTEWLQWVGWTATFFGVGLLVDGMFKYRFQLTYTASHAGVPGRARARTRPAVRHVLILVLVCLAEYLHHQRVQDPLSSGLLALYALAALYTLLLALDSIRELKQP